MAKDIVGVATATINFALVEMWPMVLLYAAVETISFEVTKGQYMLRVPSIERKDGCTCAPSETLAEFDQLLSEALHAFAHTWDLHFTKQGKCTHVHFDNNNWASPVNCILEFTLSVAIAIHVIQYLMAMARATENWSFYGGEYIWFTLKREERPLFRYALFAWVLVAAVAAVVGTTFIGFAARNSGLDVWGALWEFFKSNLIGLIMFLWATYKLHDVIKTGTLNKWDTPTFKKIMFVRPVRHIFYKSNDSVYEDLIAGGDVVIQEMTDGPENYKLWQECSIPKAKEGLKVEDVKEPLLPKSSQKAEEVKEPLLPKSSQKAEEVKEPSVPKSQE